MQIKSFKKCLSINETCINTRAATYNLYQSRYLTKVFMSSFIKHTTDTYITHTRQKSALTCMDRLSEGMYGDTILCEKRMLKHISTKEIKLAYERRMGLVICLYVQRTMKKG